MNYKGIAENIIDLAWGDLTQWEKDFVQNIYDDSTSLSSYQKKKIREIQDKHLKY